MTATEDPQPARQRGSDCTLSIITATRNAIEHIATLFESLAEQSSKAFEWVVVDCCSDDGTREFLEEKSLNHSWVQSVSEPDFGFYDALNKGIKRSSGEYYLVLGADDSLMVNAVENYLSSIASSSADVILANVEKEGTVTGGFHPTRAWLGHASVFIGSHSVGMAFKKSLHDRFGFYSSRFPLLADGYLLKKMLNAEGVTFHTVDFVAGTFAVDGMSNVNKLQSLAETWQIQMTTERAPILQTALFLAKLVIRMSSICVELKPNKTTKVR